MLPQRNSRRRSAATHRFMACAPKQTAARRAARFNGPIMEAIMSEIDVVVAEVWPRDGLQNTRQFMPTDYKKKNGSAPSPRPE